MTAVFVVVGVQMTQVVGEVVQCIYDLIVGRRCWTVLFVDQIMASVVQV